eukprot:gnl/TRDRNA2_/TRDRNA2_65132_c0_seq1.p1 gnl/TRDRNA2_/TRDRNA2_65132_c0~~gnl/TRDRNA2_/TRDRNA2_65132_c0_seq1.p1  ORF type:complete len:194 (-),score=14.06 gnl/TRDRNA2_/TRDRNA2_65132_c0_seq1:113-694(-)
MLTFPAVFVRGAFLGGLEQLRDVVSTGRLNDLLLAPRQSFPSDVGLVDDPVKLLTGPRGQRWFTFQLHVYGNFVRMLSLLHVVLFAIILAVHDVAPGLVTGVLWVIVADLAIFTLTGPTPVAPICTLVTLFVWRFRGNAVTSLPYKAIIGAAYIYGIATTLACSGSTDSCNGGLTRNIGILLLNSTFLAFFRF